MSRRLQAMEAVYWILAATAGTVVGLSVLSIVFGDGLLTLKYLLFVVGFLFFGMGSFALWRGTRRRPTIWPSVDLGPDREDDFPLERRLWELPGLRGEWLPPADRVSRPIKLFLAGLLVLAISYTMEAVFGVAV